MNVTVRNKWKRTRKALVQDEESKGEKTYYATKFKTSPMIIMIIPTISCPQSFPEIDPRKVHRMMINELATHPSTKSNL